MRERYYRASEVDNRLDWHEKNADLYSHVALDLGLAVATACGAVVLWDTSCDSSPPFAIFAVIWVVFLGIDLYRAAKHDRRKPKLELLSADDSGVTAYPACNNPHDTAKD